MRDLRLLYPLLFAALPILHTVASNNAGTYVVTDLTLALAVVFVGAGALYALLWLLVRRRWSAEQTALLFLVAVLWFWKVFRPATRIVEPRLARLALALGVLAATVALVVWLFRRPRALDRATTFLALTGGMLVVWSSVGIAADQLRNGRALRGNAIIEALAHPIVSPAQYAAAEPRRDIYLIVLDEYSHSSTLRDDYGFDNRPFEDSLRQLGFTIPPMVRSNYSYTLFSLPSLLNFTLLDGMREIDTHLPHYLVRHSRAAAFLKSRGYRFVFVPSQWWIATQHQPAADAEVRVWRQVGFDRGLTTVDLWRDLRRTSLLSYTPVGGFQHDADYVLRTFQALKELPPSEQPTFVFAHILSPHWPFVLDSTCGVNRRGMRPQGGKAAHKAAYVDQIRCVNRQTLDLARTLLARSRVPPIILLQSDHGGKWTHGFEYVTSVAALSADQAQERFNAFGAYYLPGGGDRAFRESLTLVNVFPKVFNHYFGAGIPLQPDRYFTTFAGQDTFWPVDRRLIDGRATVYRTGAPWRAPTDSSSPTAAPPLALPRSASAR